MRDDRPLTVTSFAILGLLAVRPWSTYELAKQIRRSLSHLWPRAESNLYAEAKRLVAGGHAAARREQCGERRRTVYRITPKGRKALREWLAAPGGEVWFESEPLLKVFFAEQGSKADLLGTLRAIGDGALIQQEALRRMAEDYRAGAGPFPQRLALSVLALGLVWEHLQATIEWSRRAVAVVEGWRKPGPGEAPVWPEGIFGRTSRASATRSAPRSARRARAARR
ncbi:MAG TPA: helix-turn-helix transcriptional regulator [Candidatus Binatia bacterium]